MFVFSELRPSSDLFIKHQRNSFSSLPLHQLPIATHQHPVVCFWVFFQHFYKQQESHVEEVWTDDRPFQMETLLRFPRGWRSKLNGQRKPPQHSAGVLHSWWFEGFSLFALPFEVCVRHDQLLTYPRQTMPNYTDLTGTSILQQFVFSCVNPPRWTPAVRWYVAHSIVVQAKDSRTKTANATRSQTLHILLSVTHIRCLVTISSRLVITFRAMSPNHLWHYQPVPAWGFRSKVHLSYFTGWDMTSSWDVRRVSMLPAGVNWAFWFRLLSVHVDLRIYCCHYHKWLTTRNGTFIILLISVNVFLCFLFFLPISLLSTVLIRL